MHTPCVRQGCFVAVTGMASVALVLSILVPSVGNWWYLLTLLSPAAWFYYFQKGERVEQVCQAGQERHLTS